MTRSTGSIAVVATLAVAAALATTRCTGRESTSTLRVLIADSLWRPFTALATTFESQHRSTRVVLVPGGSVLAARRIVEANDRADVLAVADAQVIDRLLKPQHADWAIRFATNEIVIAYTTMSRGAAALTRDNWFDVLTGDGVQVAAANPFHDPCGYWTLLCWRLADRHHGTPHGAESIYQRLSARCGPPSARRTDAQQLLHLLESPGGVDYAFVYRSQAEQHNLACLILPAEINLGDPAHQSTYRTVQVDLDVETGGGRLMRRGDTIVYALTIPRGAARPDLAATFIAFLLGPEGRAILEREHLPLVAVPWTENNADMPSPLRALVAQRDGDGDPSHD